MTADTTLALAVVERGLSVGEAAAVLAEARRTLRCPEDLNSAVVRVLHERAARHEAVAAAYRQVAA